MRLHRHVDVTTDVGLVRATMITSEHDLRAAVALLDDLEAAAGVPLVDEAERDRLREEGPERPEAEHWHALLASREGRSPQGYAGIVLTPGASEVVGDVAVARDRPCGDLLQALLQALAGLARGHGADNALVWVRHAAVDDLDCARAVGWEPDRRLDVLRLHLDDRAAPVTPGRPVLPAGLELRSWSTPADDGPVAAVLAAAYADTPESGWDAAKVAERRRLPWFEGADLLLAVDAGGTVHGVHWTKRRGPTTGEVYNLAVHPDAQGTGLGRALLVAGTDHLADIGVRDVLLWVDRDNARAADLYRRHGFQHAWTDLAVRLRTS